MPLQVPFSLVALILGWSKRPCWIIAEFCSFERSRMQEIQSLPLEESDYDSEWFGIVILKNLANMTRAALRSIRWPNYMEAKEMVCCFMKFCKSLPNAYLSAIIGDWYYAYVYTYIHHIHSHQTSAIPKSTNPTFLPRRAMRRSLFFAASLKVVEMIISTSRHTPQHGDMLRKLNLMVVKGTMAELVLPCPRMSKGQQKSFALGEYHYLHFKKN